MQELSLSDINADLVHLRSWVDFARPADEGHVNRLAWVKRLMTRLPALERDVIEQHYFCGRSQEQIGQVLGLTQQAVSHRMRRAISRLAFLIEHPDLPIEIIQRDLDRVWPDAPDVMCHLLAVYVRTSSQCQTAEAVGIDTRMVRQYLTQARLHFHATPGQTAKRYAATLDRLRRSRSILCEVSTKRVTHAGTDHSPRRPARQRARPAAAHGHSPRAHTG